MSKELAKTYDPKDMEPRIYKKWLDKNYFHAEVDRSKKPFTIVIPPPNITGQLHMGHAFDNTMQDILIRFKRMQGYNALWQPGCDHASIATEVKIIEKLKSEGIDKEDLGREGFLKRAWEWKEEYGGRIVEQLKKLGSSCDWERERFTMDEGCNKAVTEVFVNLYNKGLIYKGNRIVNWCPVCQTTISDAEVEHEEQAGHFWHIRYPKAGTKEAAAMLEGRKCDSPDPDNYVVVATTRPETMLGDTALAVNPDDERYTEIAGKTVILPLMNKDIPVIKDSYVDKEFGTGVVKITPAHDPNDFEVGKRHDLEVINIMNDDATINEKGGKYKGMERYEARKQVVADLEALGLLVKVEDHSHNVGTHDRCGCTIEPMAKAQWFVAMEKLAEPAIEVLKATREGRDCKYGSLQFVPERFDKTYLHWLEGIRDWCISRQLWWGHRIPAWYCRDCGEVIVAKEAPTVCPKCGKSHLKQDEDVLDTWFSSALWPFSTLGWPEKTEELDYFYPTDVLVTGYDIIFFWVVRMVFSGIEHTGHSPFHTVLIHGLVRDSQGRKMSKSLGNGIDPLEIIDKYGADALRLMLMTGNAPGNDMRFYYEKVEACRNFANKVWNASRFIMMNIENKTVTKPDDADLEPVDKWIISKLNTVVRDVTDNMEKYELGIAVGKIYDFIWDEFCDWYIEMVKPRLYNSEDTVSQNAALYTLKSVLIDALKLLHPYMPFITEEIYCTLQYNEGISPDPSDASKPAGSQDTEAVDSIMISSWPVYSDDKAYEKEEKAIEIIKEAVRGIRNARTGMNVPPSKKAHVFIVTKDQDIQTTFKEGELFFASLAYASQVTIQADKSGIADDAVSVVIPGVDIYIPFAELVDIKQEIERLKKEEARLEGELKRVNGMLNNEKFISKAPAAKIEEEKAKLEKYTQMMTQVRERLAQLS
ncbi:MAG: valine--tRNA ligase [Lachnospiraceae bacterium]|nr:valine--tRNA ligase [Lachnospiraceae bacterium]